MRRVFGCSVLLLLGAAGPGMGQMSPPGTGGVAALTHALNQLGAEKRVLFIAAHPDDEDTQLLTWLARGLGAQAAYLSLSRGEGGQNLIGPELGIQLGIIRTEELLAARALDGARQYFTRAYDFGFSKTLEETHRFWPADTLLRDVVAVIRRFRPQIIVTNFTGTPRDGHGQHQAAGAVAHRAFELTRDSAWGPRKLYRSSRFDPGAATVRIDGGALDPVAGQSYYQIAMASRSRHRSQDMGQLQRPGPSTIALAFVAGPRGSDTALFAGVDTVLAGRARYRALIDSARARLSPWDLGAVVPYLARAHAELASGTGPAELEQRALIEGALGTAAGVAVDGVADDGVVTRGQRIQVEVTVWNAGADEIRLDAVELVAPAGWRVERLDAAASPVAPGTVATRRFAVHVPADAPRTAPYFLRRPLIGGGYYDWTGVPADVRGLPFGPAPVRARASLTIAGAGVTLEREVVYRYRDQAVGEVRRPLFVTQAFDVSVSPATVVWPADGASPTRQFTARVVNRARGAATGRLIVTPPPGWSVTLAADTIAFEREDEEESVGFSLTAPRAARLEAGSYTARVAVQGADGRAEGSLLVIDHPHIRPRALAEPSAVAVRAAPLVLPGIGTVGYVRGAADRVPEELLALGVPLELLGPDTLARGELSRFGAIVIGSRAYETDAALVANNRRILDYARAGGLVIVQYQQYAFVTGGFAPFPLTIGRPHDRVTDETAPVTAIDSAHPVLRVPHAIAPADWAGWVQERGLYFAREWDSTYVPVLETADPGGPPLRGGLLIAPLGRGTYVYTGLSFFRQLPAGVPGAYRLFLNLLALRRASVP
jgi:LmbE family N-acetylglucosaminyl deacetylase